MVSGGVGGPGCFAFSSVRPRDSTRLEWKGVTRGQCRYVTWFGQASSGRTLSLESPTRMIRALFSAFTVLFSAALCLSASRSLHALEDPRLDYHEPLVYEFPIDPPLRPAEAFLQSHAKEVGGNAGGVDVIAVRISDLRCVQLEYFGDEGGTVVCTWALNNRFDRIFVSVDNASRGSLTGDATGTDLGVLAPGEHKIRVEGAVADRTQVVETIVQVLRSSPIIIEPTQWVASGFTAAGVTGTVRVTWEVFNPLDLPLQNFEICVYLNNQPECQRFHRSACADLIPNADGTCDLRTSLTLSKLASGCYRFEVQTFSNRYASSIGGLCASGRPLPGPIDPVCTAASCANGRINSIELKYTTPENVEYDAVAVWSIQNGATDFLGFVDPFADGVALRGLDLAVEPFEIELAGARRLDHTEVCPELQAVGGVNEPGDIGFINPDVDFATMCPNVLAAEDQVPGEDPNNPAFAAQLVLYTVLPSDIGPHTRAVCEPVAGDFGCPPPRERIFRRGDVDGDGEVDIVDALALLFFMFRGVGELHCPDAADIDNNGSIQLNDPIRLLTGLFLGRRAAITDPGPFVCGYDSLSDLANAADDDLPFCRYPTESCDTLLPVDPVDPDLAPVARRN